MGTDAKTGRKLMGWAHVVQSLGIIWSTSLGEREMREWFGGTLVGELGKPLTRQRAVTVMQKISVVAELWEPRFKVIRIVPLRVAGDGVFKLRVDGEYRPRGHLGDTTAAGRRSVFIGPSGVE
jgi:hypothetical protein